MEGSAAFARDVYRSGLEPERQLTVTEWADEYRYLSTKASAEPGKWKTDRTPYLAEIMDCLSSNHPCESVAFMKGSQIGGTETGNNWLGYIIDHCPAPVMAVQPTIDMAKRNSKQRIGPLVEETPSLCEKVGSRSKRDSSNNMLEKEFPGGMLILAGANSAAGLKSTPCRFVFFDEIDEYPPDLDGQGDPIGLAEARSRTFNRRKWFYCGTPTVEGQSAIDDQYKATDMRQFHVPCPDCNEKQVLDFGQLRFTKTEGRGGRPEATDVYYECEHCQYKIRNWQKTKMLKAGKWIPQNPGANGGRSIGFFLSALYSPVGWYSWEDVATDFLKAKAVREKLKVFVNTVLGETWKEKSEKPDFERLYENRQNYQRNVIPDAVSFLTCGVDVQGDRLELEIVGWCRDKISYSIDYRILMGDPSKPLVWRDLSRVLGETFPRAGKDAVRLPIRMMAVDSGYATQSVYSWVRKYPSNRVIAVKGFDQLQVLHGIPKSVDVTIKGKTVRRGLKLWPVGSSVLKAELYGWLKQTRGTDGEAPPPGYCFFPEYDPEYFKMLTAEELVVRVVKGFKKYEWHKTRERNEALDCRIYARSAASIIGMDRFKDENWEALSRDYTPVIETTKEPTKPVTSKSKKDSFW